MEKTMKKLLGIALLTMVSLGAYAQDDPLDPPTDQSTKVAVGFYTYTGGTVVEKSQSAPDAENGSVTVTITVKPDKGYYIFKRDIIVLPTRPTVRKTQGDVEDPKLAEPLTLTGDDPADLTAERDYAFVVPQNLGALVYQADFQQIATSGTIGEKDEAVAWNVDEKTVTVGEGDEAQPVEVCTLTFTGAAAIPAIASAPWEMLKTRITNVVIGEGITAIGANLLAGFTSLKSIEIQNDKAVLGLGENAIPAVEGLTIDVPGNLYNEYLVTDGWKSLSIGSAAAVVMTGVEFTDANSYDTFVFDQAVKIPSVLSAYIIVGIKDNVLVLEEIKDGIIPAGVPVLLLSKELKGNDFRTAKAASETKGGAATGNLLKVAPEGGKEVALGEVYLLYNDVFYLSQAGTIAEGGIYLTIPEPKPDNQPTKARLSYALRIGDADAGTTGISTVKTNAAALVWYGIDGRRLNGVPAQKGLYIINGKKVVIK